MRCTFMLAALLLAGCSYGPPMPNGEALPVSNATFACADGSKIVATFNEPPRTAQLEWPGQRILEIAEAWSASGARYADARGEFWNKGRDATWVPADGKPVNCHQAQ
jgi:membrane-bound inhibitor of C-type lysozyme